jgi:serine phosphatase RsbU (regulator of sigma subunit)
VFTLCIGNVTVPIMARLEPYYGRRAFPLNWLVYLPLLALVGLSSTVVATVVLYWLFLAPLNRTHEHISTDIRFGTLVTIIIGIVFYIYRNMRANLETQNVKLQQAVQSGEARLEQQEKELETAREIQAGLIPKEIPQLDGFQISASWQPARAVGGDYFDVVKLDGQRVAVCIADVVGKGIAAALLMANVQAAFRAFATGDAPPSEICDRLNHVLCSNLAPGKFVTFLCCLFDTKSGTLTYCNAGHCFPLLARSGGQIVSLTEGGLVLGVMPESKYLDSLVTLEAKDKLLLYTDGITEATNSSGEEFGEARLEKSLLALVDSEIDASRSKLMGEVSLFCGGNFTDDATLLLLRMV